MIKRLNYTQVRLSIPGGVIEIKPSDPSGFAVAFESTKEPRISFGKTIEEAGALLVADMKRIVSCIEEDLKAFVERNNAVIPERTSDTRQVK